MRESPSLAQRIAVLGLFVLLAVGHTWPLARRPAVYSRVDNGDYSLNAWAVDWVARTLPTDPLNLFDANIFYPARLTLAYSEPLILQGALAMPSVWMGASAIATYSLVLLAGFALSGWAFAMYVRGATGSWLAGVVSGSAVAFNAHHLVRLVHLQALHLELLPLVFMALDALITTGRLRYAALFGAAVAAQATQSIYLLVFAGWAAISAWLSRLPEWRRQLRVTAAAALVAGATCAVLLLPLLWPYATLARTHGMVRQSSDAMDCAATWTDYLYTGSRLHYEAWSRHFDNSSDASFPGLVVTGLAVFAVVGAAGRSARIHMWLAVTIGSVLLSVLPRLPGFAWLHDHVSVLAAIRCYSRAGQLALVGMGVLAGFGAARLLATRRSTRAATLAGIALVAAVNVEALRAPLGYREYPGVPAIYDRLREERRAVVIELPLYGRHAFFSNAEYMINATRHRHPIVNGYSGFTPPDFDEIDEAMKSFPGYESLQLMHRLGVTHVVVHWSTRMDARRAEIDASPALRRLAEQDDIALYRFADR